MLTLHHHMPLPPDHFPATLQDRPAVTPQAEPSEAELDEFRDGILHLQTRRFATVTELMIRGMTGAGDALNQHHDLFDTRSGQRIEVKFCVVRQRADARITAANVLDVVSSASAQNRRVSFEDWEFHQFGCNIQQVKREDFDVLYYGLFFEDAVVVFRIPAAMVGERIHYSRTQHKGNTGEGQFHITHHNLQLHLDNFHECTLSYVQVHSILRDVAQKACIAAECQPDLPTLPERLAA